jgi:hypothetical protein
MTRLVLVLFQSIEKLQTVIRQGVANTLTLPLEYVTIESITTAPARILIRAISRRKITALMTGSDGFGIDVDVEVVLLVATPQ